MPASRDGTVLMDRPCSYVGPFKRQIILIDDAAAADNGVWLDASDLLYFTIEISAFSGSPSAFSFQLYGSNAAVQPTTFNATDTKIGSAITTLGFSSFTGPYRWINLRLGTGPTGGNVQANLQALTQ